MIANMAKPRSSSKGKTEGPDLFAFAADRGDGPRSPEPAAAERAEPAAVADPAATAGQLLAGLDKLPSSDLLSLVSALGVEVARRGLMPVRVVDEPAPKAGARLKPSSASAGKSVTVTSRQVVGLFLEQLRFEYVPALHRLQGRLTVQG